MTTTHQHYEKKIFSRFGVEAGFLPDLCLIASAFVILIVRMATLSASTVTPLALELTIVQFLVASMCWAIRQYSVDYTHRGDVEYAALPRQMLLFIGIALTLGVGYMLTYFLSPERGVNLFLLVIMAGNVALFFLVALFVVETIPIGRITLLTLALFAGAAVLGHYFGIESKSELSMLVISTVAFGILGLALLSKRTGSAGATGDFFRFLFKNPLFLLCGPLYLFGFWLDKWIYWFFIDNRGLDHTLLRPHSGDMSGVLAALFTIPALLVAYHSFRTDISRNYQSFTAYILGKGSLSEIESTRAGVSRAIKIGCLNTAIIQAVFSIGLVFLAPALVESLDSELFTSLAIQSAAVGNIFFVVYAYLFRALLYFEDSKAAFWSGIGFCLGSIVFSCGMMFFDVSYGGIGLAMASTVGIVTAVIPLRKRLQELDYLFFTMYQSGGGSN